MNRRARRVMVLTAAPVAVLVAGLFVAHWSTVRDHVAAWHFQLTRHTETIEQVPEDALFPRIDQVPEDELYPSRTPVLVIYDPAELGSWRSPTVCRNPRSGTLWADGFKIIGQRFPRKACVLIRAGERAEHYRLFGWH